MHPVWSSCSQLDHAAGESQIYIFVSLRDMLIARNIQQWESFLMESSKANWEGQCALKPLDVVPNHFLKCTCGLHSRRTVYRYCLLRFVLAETENDSYFLMRSGEGGSDKAGVIQSHPIDKLHADNGLTEQGVLEVRHTRVWAAFVSCDSGRSPCSDRWQEL